MTKIKSRKVKRSIARNIKRSKGRNVKRSRGRNVKRSRKKCGGTKSMNKVKNKKDKLGVKNNMVKKGTPVKSQGWTLYSGPNAESIYPAYFKKKELKKIEKDHKKVQADLAAAEYLHSKRPQHQPQWKPSTLPPPDIELLMPGF